MSFLASENIKQNVVVVSMVFLEKTIVSEALTVCSPDIILGG